MEFWHDLSLHRLWLQNETPPFFNEGPCGKSYQLTEFIKKIPWNLKYYVNTCRFLYFANFSQITDPTKFFNWIIKYKGKVNVGLDN